VRNIKERLYRRRQTRRDPLLLRHHEAFQYLWAITLIGCAVTSLVASWFMHHPKTYNWANLLYAFTWPFAIGGSIAFATNEILGMRSLKRREKFAGRLVASVMVIGENDEGENVVSITRQNGEMSTVTMPADYDPRSDGFQALLHKFDPELYGID
jgi:hypothetical protein